jgi:hypothetical protein
LFVLFRFQFVYSFYPSVLLTECNFICVHAGHQVIVEFNAHKEKLMKEKITLRSANSDEVLFLIFQARVLGKLAESKRYTLFDACLDLCLQCDYL